MTPTAQSLTPFLLPNPGLREKPGLLRLVVGGPADGQVRSSPSGYTLNAVQASARTLAELTATTSSEYVEFTTLTYYAEEVSFAGHSWRTWRLDGVSEADHVRDAMLALVRTVHELDLRSALLTSGQDPVDSTT